MRKFDSSLIKSFIELKYVYSIDRAKDIVGNVNLGSEIHLYKIPQWLNRCEGDLECLKVGRARDDYDEFNNALVLDNIEQMLKTVIKEMKTLTTKYECDIEKKVKNELLLSIQLAQVLGMDSSMFNCDLINKSPE